MECRFQDTNSRWNVLKNTQTGDNCNNEEFCQAAADLSGGDCEYILKPLREDAFGAEVFGLSLGYGITVLYK